MREAFKTPKFKLASLKLIEQANEIIKQYRTDGIQLTLRQLYYQFVAKNLIPNDEKNYKNLGAIISEARLCGLIDWSAIDDLGRVPSMPHWDTDLPTFLQQMKQMASAYSLDRWQGQSCYVELHVEKQAAQSVLQPIASQWGVGFSQNKGYSSQTAFYDAAKRFIRATDAGKRCVVIYAGDHDPSGMDMLRDFEDRMALFGADVELQKIAITHAQVKRFKCPPNPAKITDPRAAKYIEEFGNVSWELDALDPKEVRRAAEKALAALVDKKVMDAVIAREEREQSIIHEALQGINA